MDIELKNLVKKYRSAKDGAEVRAVDGISLAVPPNSIYGIIGKSGAGKSSLVRLASLLERPDSGEVRYDGQRVDSLSEKEQRLCRRRFGMIFQNFNLFSSRTAGQNIAYPLELCRMHKAAIEKRVGEMLALVDLSDKKDAPISTLSGGQKQRIAIARALAHKPDVLFCDEATSALDPQTTKSILDLIRAIQSEMKLTVIMITHQMEVVRDACSFVAVLDRGRIAETGSVNDIFLSPKAPVTRDFLTHISRNDTASENMVRWSDGGGKFILRFMDDATDRPILSEATKRFDVEFNIRAGGIQHLTENKIGTLITDIAGPPDALSDALAFIRAHGVKIEEAAAGGREHER